MKPCQSLVYMYKTGILYNISQIYLGRSQRHHWYYLEGPSWPWSYGSWIYNYLCNKCLSPL